MRGIEEERKRGRNRRRETGRKEKGAERGERVRQIEEMRVKIPRSGNWNRKPQKQTKKNQQTCCGA
jgi:hypothetical protein